MMQSNKTSIAVLGGGSFGTALSHIAASNGHSVSQWMRDDQRVKEINEQRRNFKYLPEAELAEALTATTDLASAIEGADLVLVAVPSKVFRKVVKEARQYASEGQYWVSTTKGIEPDGFHLMSDILLSELSQCKIGVLSGPNLAKEIANESLTGTVIASEHEDLRTLVQESLSNRFFRVYANSDMYGVELGGALKNIYAIVSGMAGALELGENTKAMLITRSLAEMSRFASATGANPMTFLGLAGVGDLIVTCTSSLSRNYRVGFALGKGETLDAIISSLGEVAEGVSTTETVKKKANELGIEMPLVEGLYKILIDRVPVEKVIKALMTREQNSDVEFILPRQE